MTTTPTPDLSHGMPPQHDWNALDDEAFRQLVRQDFDTHYPQALRFVPNRLRSPRCACPVA